MLAKRPACALARFSFVTSTHAKAQHKHQLKWSLFTLRLTGTDQFSPTSLSKKTGQKACCLPQRQTEQYFERQTGLYRCVPIGLMTSSPARRRDFPHHLWIKLDRLSEVFCLRDQRHVTKELMLKYDRKRIKLEINELTRGLVGKYVDVYGYGCGRIQVRANNNKAINEFIMSKMWQNI